MPAASFFTFSQLLEPPMRLFVLIAFTALALAACGKDAETDGGGNAGAGLTADTIVANDVTAIDAVTADAANMAADMDYADALAQLNDSGQANAGAVNPARASRPSARSATPAARAPGRAESPAETETNTQ